MNSLWAIASLVIKELYRRKDFYVLFILTVLITGLFGSISIFNDERIVRYLKAICLLLIWMAALVIAIVTTARQIPAEREQRTIFPLLAKPVTRAHVVGGKFLGCWLAAGIALVVFYVFFALLSGTREHTWPIANYAQALWLHWLMLAMVIALTLAGSVLFTAPSSNATICFIVTVGILLVGRHLNTVTLQLREPASSLVSVVYYLIPHLEFFDVRDLVIHDWPPIPWSACALATLYALAYTACFLLAAWWRFRRQPLN
ncbi:MAG: ABC transporter permease [Verrucomicrobia bacterium]|nr:ABC transporter permease [Verrucomicrobiota bacterium]